MSVLERTNLERPLINSNTTSNKVNKPERITHTKKVFFTLIANETKTNLQIILQNKRRYVMTKT